MHTEKQNKKVVIVVREREPVLFIVNPVSGAGKASKLTNFINKGLDLSKYSPEVLFSKGPNTSSEIARDAMQNGIKKIFAAGGDGTVNEVASALINTECVLGIIPFGSGNGLARHLRIPLNPAKAISLINREKIAMVDYGIINKTPFFCTAGTGFDALVGYKFDQTKGRGFANYFKTTAREYFNYKSQHYTLFDNEHRMEREAFVITVANASQFGNNAYIAPDAEITDGLLDVTVISPFPKYLSPSIGIKLFNKTLGKSRYVEMFRVSSLTIKRHEEEGYVHYDGEPKIMGDTINFNIKHLGLKVYVP